MSKSQDRRRKVGVDKELNFDPSKHILWPKEYSYVYPSCWWWGGGSFPTTLSSFGKLSSCLPSYFLEGLYVTKKVKPICGFLALYNLLEHFP